jgi:H+/Cl- antiporter ClcA
MRVKHFLKNAGIVIAIALIALVIGVIGQGAGEFAWDILGRLSRGEAGSGFVSIDLSVTWFSVALAVLVAVGLMVGFRWVSRRLRARSRETP